MLSVSARARLASASGAPFSRRNLKKCRYALCRFALSAATRSHSASLAAVGGSAAASAAQSLTRRGEAARQVLKLATAGLRSSRSLSFERGAAADAHELRDLKVAEHKRAERRAHEVHERAEQLLREPDALAPRHLEQLQQVERLGEFGGHADVHVELRAAPVDGERCSGRRIGQSHCGAAAANLHRAQGRAR